MLMLLLGGAPAAALGHLLLTWLPPAVAVLRLQRQAARETVEIEAEWREYHRIREQVTRLRGIASQHDGQRASPCLPNRQPHTVFEKLGQLLSDERISVRQLKFAEPCLCAVVPPRDVLACEDITLECSGDYAALSQCLDRMLSLDVPVRCRQMVWLGEGDALRLTAQIEVPFVADAVLRQELIGEAELEELDES
jgi:hypothetical protein